MELLRDPLMMRARAEELRAAGRRLCVVPTMGFLHDGHVALLAAGRAEGDVLVLTIFVNPTQFGPNEDLDRYPRDEAGDLAKAEAAGVDIAFCPDAGAMYPQGYGTEVAVSGLSAPLCGKSRPGHFAGVTTVVTKLFHLTMPHAAVFGEKDFQQLAIIRRMVRDLDFGIEIVSHPIVREDDGLAMSSRNKYLSADERQRALAIHRGLRAAAARFAGGERSVGILREMVRDEILASGPARIDYVEILDAESLAAVEQIEAPAVVAVAAVYGTTRLIDNMVLRP